MKYELIMVKKDKTNYSLFYNTENNQLTTISGNCVQNNNFKKYDKGYTLALILGKRCNNNCKYCSQALSKNFIDKKITFKEQENMVKNIIRFFYNRKIQSIEFWGGEGLIYFDLIVNFVALFEKYLNYKIPNYVLFTNGKLLGNDSIFQFLKDNKFQLFISYDGDGQEFRGEDILKNNKIFSNIIELYKSNPYKTNFYPVITKYNPSLKKYVQKITNILGSNQFSLGQCRLVNVANESSYECCLTDEQLYSYSRETYLALINNELPQYQWAFTASNNFCVELNKSIPLITRCSILDSKTLTLEMDGNIAVCYNNGTQDKEYNLGNIFELKTNSDIPLPKLDQYEHRRLTKCKDCLVVGLCKGGCAFLPKEYEELNCKIDYYEYLPILSLALHMVTGDLLKKLNPLN